MSNNNVYKTLVLCIFSLIVTFAFALYNAYLGIKFSDTFAIAISIYYILLIWVKVATIVVEKRIWRKEEEYKARVRTKNYKISFVFVIIIDLALIAPILLMVVYPKEVNFGIIPAIAMATYSFYKIISSIINYKRSKRSQNLTIILLRELNIIEAVVSILILQHTLIMVNGGMVDSMRSLSFVTSVGFILWN